MEIGDRIRQRRIELNMSQDELAKKVGYKSRSSINKIESDGRGLPQTKIVTFAKALETTPSYLMGWTDSPLCDDNKYAECITELRSDEHQLLGYYNRLNDFGKAKAISDISDMTELSKYTKDTASSSA